MADNVTIKDASDASIVIACDDIGGIEYQIMKNAYGAADSVTQVDASNPLPVVDASTATISTSASAINTAIGAQADAEVTGNGSLIAIVKKLRTLLNGGLPAALGANSGLKIDSLSQAARSRTVDAIAAAMQTDAIMNGLTALTPKFAKGNIAASQTDSSIVAAVASKKIRVLCAYAVAGGTATNLTFNSKPAGAGTAISALLANGANGGEILPFSPVGWFETVAGEGLTVTTAAGSTTGLGVVYVEV